MTNFRPAQETDLRAVYEVFYQNEVLDSPHPPSPGDIPSYLRHVLQTGTLYVAEQEREVCAFAGAITRGNITFLTDLFVQPVLQSGQLGKTLLHSVLPQDDLIHCTVSSSDPRALALYIRAGMSPQWPYFALRLEKSTHEWRLTGDMEIIEADPGDPALVQWDAQISGRLRPIDHLYWLREQRAVPLWFRRQGRIVAAVSWASQRADVLHIDVPGPHPCLAILLERGFRIAYVDTFVTTAGIPFFDARCYIPSGGDLF
jgi:Acetyltransferase (GNAT) family